MKLITRSEAIAAGAVRFFTGVPCKYGHVDERRVDNSDCVQCVRQRSARQRLANPQKVSEAKRKCYEQKREVYAAKQKAYYQENRVAVIARAEKYRLDNREAVLIRQAAYRGKNRERLNAWQLSYADRNRDQERARARAYYIDHPARVKANAVKRKADQLQRTPAWADTKAIRRIYEDRPSGYHVDHVIPLRGKYVSGLHVETNLQYLPAVENLRKNDRFEAGAVLCPIF